MWLDQRLVTLQRIGSRLRHGVEVVQAVEALRTRTVRPAPERLDLTELVRRLAEAVSREADETASTCAVLEGDPLLGNWDRNALELALSVLMRHLSRVAAGGSVEVRVFTDAGARVSIAEGRTSSVRQASSDRSQRRGELAGTEASVSLWIAAELLAHVGGSLSPTGGAGGAAFLVALPLPG